MEIKKIVAATATTVTLLTLATPVLANTEATPFTHSTGRIRFRAGDGNVDIIDPNNPSEIVDVEPDPDHGGGTVGALSLNFAPGFNFAEWEISTNDQVYNALPIVIDGGERNHFAQVTDMRGTAGAGWALTVEQVNQFTAANTPVGNHELVGAEIRLSNARHSTNTTYTDLQTHAGTISLVPGGTAQTVLSADFAAGTHQVVWGTELTDVEGTLKNTNVELFVPGTSTQLTGVDYTTTLLWTLSDTVSNY